MGRRASYDPPGYTPRPSTGELSRVLESEFSERFVDGMRNRMIVSHYKYGPVAQGYPDRVDALRSLEERLELYRQTGNAEWLIDVANFAMIEFMHPRHPGSHFRPTDQDESPGRVRSDCVDRHGPNTPPDTAVDRLRERFARGD